MGYRRSTHVAWRKVGGQTVVINLRSSTVLGFNDPGGALWEKLGETATPSVEPGDRATEEFFERLRDEGLVEAVETVETVETGGGESWAGTTLPAIVWREKLQAFVAGCPPVPGAGYPCDQQPGS